MHQASFGNPEARHILVEIAEACRREAESCTMDGIHNCYGSC